MLWADRGDTSPPGHPLCQTDARTWPQSCMPAPSPKDLTPSPNPSPNHFQGAEIPVSSDRGSKTNRSRAPPRAAQVMSGGLRHRGNPLGPDPQHPLAWASTRSNHGSIPRVTATAALGPSPRRLPSLPGRRQWPTCASGAQHQHRTQRCHRTHRVHRASTPLADAGGSAGGWFCAEPWGRRSVSIINSHLSLNPIGTASLQPRRGQAASAHAAPKVPGMSPQR